MQRSIATITAEMNRKWDMSFVSPEQSLKRSVSLPNNPYRVTHRERIPGPLARVRTKHTTWNAVRDG